MKRQLHGKDARKYDPKPYPGFSADADKNRKLSEGERVEDDRSAAEKKKRTIPDIPPDADDPFSGGGKER